MISARLRRRWRVWKTYASLANAKSDHVDVIRLNRYEVVGDDCKSGAWSCALVDC